VGWGGGKEGDGLVGVRHGIKEAAKNNGEKRRKKGGGKG